MSLSFTDKYNEKATKISVFGVIDALNKPNTRRQLRNINIKRIKWELKSAHDQ